MKPNNTITFFNQKNIHHDIQVVVDASNKWKNKKLVKDKKTSILPETITTGKELIEFIESYFAIVNAKFDYIHSYVKYLSLVSDYLDTLIETQTFDKTTFQFNKLCKYNQDFVNSILKKASVGISVAIGRLDSMIAHKIPKAPELVQCLLSPLDINSIDIEAKQSSNGVTFSKEEIRQFQNCLNKNLSSNFIKHIDHLFNKINNTTQSEIFIDRAIKKAKEQSLPTDVMHFIKMLRTFTTSKGDVDDYHLEASGADQAWVKKVINPLMKDIEHLQTIIIDSVQLIEKTDGWLSSKNI